MKRFDKAVDEKYETKSVMLHFDMKYLAVSVLGSSVVTSKSECSQTFVLRELLEVLS